MFRKKTARQFYVVPFTVLESDARTPLADFFSILLERYGVGDSNA
jgi:hypothetical protein